MPATKPERHLCPQWAARQRWRRCSLWMFCCLLQLVAYAAAVAPSSPPPPPPAPAATPMPSTVGGAEHEPTTGSSTVTATAAAATFNGSTSAAANTRPPPPLESQAAHGRFPALDKEVVERLIKQWAPVVWLAPEEKFMPLGVEEFLNHVHPMDKGKSFIPGMPIGDTSKKAYLVTNSEIDELLDNDSSFIYGRNPNESPVPIYAVVTLCHERAPELEQLRQPPQELPEGVPMQQQQQQQQQQPLPPAPVVSNTRGLYIPVSIDPLEEGDDAVRRSSRLYPVFQRMRRDISAATAKVAAGNNAGTDATYMSSPVLLNIPPAASHELVTGETSMEGSGGATVSGGYEVPIGSTTMLPEGNSAGASVNNFIANLVDNVKFSPMNGMDDELDNNINSESSYNEQASMGMNSATRDGGKRKFAAFHVTYWMFYPYSQGKTMCTLSLGPLGSIPFPAVYGFCLGRRKDIGSHIGDWEHMSLHFNGAAEPEAMYVSAHDAGAYYTYNRLTGSFEFKKQETRKGILQRPNFPKTVTTFNDHPVLFAAKGSHGLWTAPGKHRFVKVARLYDINGFGTPWNTWKAVDITYENLKSYGRSLVPTWLAFKGKWGNPKSKCHPFRRIGLNFCEYTDGPTGIPLKEPHFQCGATIHR